MGPPGNQGGGGNYFKPPQPGRRQQEQGQPHDDQGSMDSGDEGPSDPPPRQPQLRPRRKPSGPQIELTAETARIGLLKSCDGCLRFHIGVRGSASSRDPYAAPDDQAGSPTDEKLELGGELAVDARIRSEVLEGRPALGIRFEEVRSFHLELPADSNANGFGGQEQLETVITTRMRSTIKAHRGQSQPISLARRFDAGKGVVLEGVGVHTATTPNNELFVGLNTNLAAEGSVRFEERGEIPQGADWGLAISEDYARLQVQYALSTGRMLAHFNRKGQLDPGGAITVDVDNIRFTATGYEADLRLWKMSSPVWRADYAVAGRLEVQNGDLVPTVERLDKRKGSGPSFLSGRVNTRQVAENTMRRISRSWFKELSLILSADVVARLEPTAVSVTSGVMTVTGRFRTFKTGE